LFCSDRLDARWFLVKGLLVMDSTSVLCSFNLVPISCHVASLSWQEPEEELMIYTSFDEGL